MSRKMSLQTDPTNPAAADSAFELARPKRPVPRSGLGKWLFGAGLLVVSIGIVAAAWPQVAAFLAVQEREGPMTYVAKRGPLTITVTEDGSVESASNVDIKCRVKGGSSILWIVEDGKKVKDGELLVRLDQSTIEDELNAQEITLAKAKSAKIQAEEEFEVAKISIEEYEKGTFVKERQDLEAEIIIAMENLRSAENLLTHTERMAKKGFVTPLQLEADRFGVQRANLELESAKTAKMVLEKYTKAKTLKDLESQRDMAEARMNAETAAYKLEADRRTRLEEQKQHCEIKATQEGMVVYANDKAHRFSQAAQIEEGATVREQQTIIRVPDLENMQVKVMVHETKVERIKPDMPARIDVMDRHMKGKVVSIANRAAAGSFFSADVKEYETIVQIEGQAKRLKPGMSAQVEILVEHLENALAIPVQAVVEQRGKFYCWVQTPEGPQRRPLLLGLTNDKLIEIKDGIAEGEEVLLNPRAHVPEAREEETADEDADRRDFASPADGGRATATGKSESRKPKAESGQRKAETDHSTHDPQSATRLMQYDKDGDGRISRGEAPEQMERFFDRLDSNGDGFIDKAEIPARRGHRQREGAPESRPETR